MRRSARLPMPGCERMAQIVPAKIMNLSSQQCIAPCLGIDLDNGVSLVSENLRRMALPAKPQMRLVHLTAGFGACLSTTYVMNYATQLKIS